MARPTKCTPKTTDEICGYISDGLPNVDAAELAGISEAAFYDWLDRGRQELERRMNPRVSEGTKKWEGEQPFVEFLERVKKAKAERKRYHIRNIKRHSDDSWQASAWLLERWDPDNFGPPSKRVNMDVTSDGEPIKISKVEVVKDYGDD